MKEKKTKEGKRKKMKEGKRKKWKAGTRKMKECVSKKVFLKEKSMCVVKRKMCVLCVIESNNMCVCACVCART